MPFRVRPARADDFQAIYEMAKLTGGGFTNLPPDKGALVEKLARSQAAFAKAGDEPETTCTSSCWRIRRRGWCAAPARSSPWSASASLSTPTGSAL
jgi:hypothetical protein